jgi:hypothetical protein
MFTVHARNYMDKEPALPPPIYAPELVAEAILHAAQHPKRDVFVGGAAKMISVGGWTMPRVLDYYMRGTMFRQQKSDVDSVPGRRDALYAPDPSQELRQRKGMRRHIAEHSPYTAATLRPGRLLTAVLGGGALFAAWGLTRRLAR